MKISFGKFYPTKKYIFELKMIGTDYTLNWPWCFIFVSPFSNLNITYYFCSISFLSFLFGISSNSQTILQNS